MRPDSSFRPRNFAPVGINRARPDQTLAASAALNDQGLEFVRRGEVEVRTTTTLLLLLLSTIVMTSEASLPSLLARTFLTRHLFPSFFFPDYSRESGEAKKRGRRRGPPRLRAPRRERRERAGPRPATRWRGGRADARFEKSSLIGGKKRARLFSG